MVLMFVEGHFWSTVFLVEMPLAVNVSLLKYLFKNVIYNKEFKFKAESLVWQVFFLEETIGPNKFAHEENLICRTIFVEKGRVLGEKRQTDIETNRELVIAKGRCAQKVAERRRRMRNTEKGMKR